MGTIAEKLVYLGETKRQIRETLNIWGFSGEEVITADTPFRAYTDGLIPSFTFNGFDMAGATFSGGGKMVADYTGTLVGVPVGTPAIEGLRYDGVAGEWKNDDGEGNPLYGTVTCHTQSGDVEVIDAPPDWGGILIEGARTNLARWSEQFDNSQWAASASIGVATNVITAPDGNDTADLIYEDTTNYKQWPIKQDLTVTPGIYTLSMFAKKTVNRSRISIYPQGAGALAYSVFDLDAGKVLGNSGNAFISSGIDPVGDDWYRIYIVVNWPITDLKFVSYITPSSTAASTYSGGGDTSYGIYIWGAQLEEGSFATSPIPTLGTTVTRTADVLRFSSEGRIRAQNCAIMGIVVPIRFLDTVNQFWFDTAANTPNRILVYDTSLRFFKRYDGVYTPIISSRPHKKDTPQQYQALWTDQGYATRSRFYENGAWRPWTAWATNSDSRPALIGTEFFIGSRVGGSYPADARYPSFKTLFLPDRASLAEYLAYVERSTVWQEVI